MLIILHNDNDNFDNNIVDNHDVDVFFTTYTRTRKYPSFFEILLI